MTTTVEQVREQSRRLSAARYEGTIRAFYPFWDAQYRPYLLAAVRELPADHFDYKPRPEMLTARQIVLHIAEVERWWIGHIVSGEPYADWVEAHADRAQGWVTAYDAPDHNALFAVLDDTHRTTQGWLNRPPAELGRDVTYRFPDGRERTWTLHWILDHVQEHEIHHRAQLNLYLRLLGLDPPSI